MRNLVFNNKKMKKQNKIILTSIIVILILGSLGALIFLYEPTAESIVGSSVLGIQEVDFFQSSSQCFSSEGDYEVSKLWLYTLRGGGLGQWANGNIDANDVNDYYDGGERPEENLKIDTLFNQYCEYPIVTNPNAKPIYKLSTPIEWACTGLSGPLQEKALEKCGSNSYYSYYSDNIFKCWCSKVIKKTGAIGSTSNFNNPSTKTDMTIQVEADGESYSKTFSSDAQIRGKIGDNVCAIWQGNTVTGQVCALSEAETIPAYISGNWKLISEDLYDEYKTRWANTLLWFNVGGKSQSDIATKINDINGYSDRALNSRVSFGTIDEPTSLTSAKISKELSSLLQYPVMTLYVRANWLGIITPIPDPKITDISSECFGAGRTGRIKVDVENQGLERGEVDLYAVCSSSNFEVQRKSISLSAKGEDGDKKIVYLDITGTTDQEEITGTCTVYVDAIENIDSKVVEVCVSGHAVCTLGEEWCENNQIWVCPNIIQPGIKEDCGSQGLICQYTPQGVPFCAESPDYCRDNPDDPICKGEVCGEWTIIPGFAGWEGFKIPDIWCHIKLFFETFTVWFAVIAGLLGGLVAGSFAHSFTKKQEPKTKWTITILTALIIGATIGIIAFSYFLWILIGLIIFGIIKIFVPGV